MHIDWVIQEHLENGWRLNSDKRYSWEMDQITSNSDRFIAEKDRRAKFGYRLTNSGANTITFSQIRLYCSFHFGRGNYCMPLHWQNSIFDHAPNYVPFGADVTTPKLLFRHIRHFEANYQTLSFLLLIQIAAYFICLYIEKNVIMIRRHGILCA